MGLTAVPAALLRLGDRIGTGRVTRVVVQVSRGIATPVGKVDVDLRYADGRVLRSTWRVGTRIAVEREE